MCSGSEENIPQGFSCLISAFVGITHWIINFYELFTRFSCNTLEDNSHLDVHFQARNFAAASEGDPAPHPPRGSRGRALAPSHTSPRSQAEIPAETRCGLPPPSVNPGWNIPAVPVKPQLPAPCPTGGCSGRERRGQRGTTGSPTVALPLVLRVGTCLEVAPLPDKAQQ